VQTVQAKLAMATIRLASVTGSTYCGGADGDSRVARTASTPTTGPGPGPGPELRGATVQRTVTTIVPEVRSTTRLRS